MDAFVPPKPNEFETIVRTGAEYDSFATMFRSTSWSHLPKLMLGGRNCFCSARIQNTASIAPAAPNECPIMDLVELTGTREPNRSLMAFASAASLNGVAAPWALMQSTASGLSPALCNACFLAALAPTPGGFGCVK